MNGRERVLLYKLAAETTMRANELRTLKVSSFNLDACTVTIEAGYSKHRQEDTLPLRPETAEELRAFCAGKMPGAKVLGGRYRKLTEKTAAMIQEDLAATVEKDDNGNEVHKAIPYTDGAGRYRDFSRTETYDRELACRERGSPQGHSGDHAAWRHQSDDDSLWPYAQRPDRRSSAETAEPVFGQWRASRGCCYGDRWHDCEWV